MGRPRLPNARRNSISIRITDADAQDMDERRGHLTRPDYVRWLVRRAREEGLVALVTDEP